MDDFKATGADYGSEDLRSGAQESVVDSPESRTDGDAVLDGRDDFVDRQEEHGQEGPDAGEGSGEDRGSDGAGQGEGQTNTRAENAAIRAARIRAQREAETRMGARLDEEIASSGVLNPYTGRPFANMKEFREYGKKLREAELTEQAKKTGKSVEELTEEEADRAFLSDLRRREEAKSAERAKTRERRAFIENDVIDFVTKHPDVDVEKLENNPSFRRFAGSRFGREPLSALYEDFCGLVSEAGRSGAEKAASRAIRSTGAGSSGGAALTPTQQRELDRWNAENPDMAMTAKEFLSR